MPTRSFLLLPVVVLVAGSVAYAQNAAASQGGEVTHRFDPAPHGLDRAGFEL